jgi:hypothetical protein
MMEKIKEIFEKTSILCKNMDHAGFDVVAELPLEVSVFIFSLLTPSDIARGSLPTQFCFHPSPLPSSLIVVVRAGQLPE